MESAVKIIKTRDYNIFKTQPGNRPLLKSDIKKVADKIAERNLLDYHPILVNHKMQVLDGQHRLAVARQNNYPISYIKLKGDLKTTQNINTTGKAWTVRDFLNSYVQLRNPDYLAFKKLLDKYQFLTISQLIGLYSGAQNHGESVGKFKEGTILKRFSDEEVLHLLETLNLYTACGLNLPSNTHFQRFITAAHRRGLVFDHSRLVKKINQNIDIVKRIPRDFLIYADTFGELYNHKLKSKVNFNLRYIK
jgi:hypothetical protein